MNREHLFRGKRVDNGEWIEGPLIKFGERAFIAAISSLAFGLTARDEVNGEVLYGFYPFFEVNPETVGEYTGLTDKNGRKIFEGDIVGAKHPEQVKAVSCLVKNGEYEDVDSLDTYHYLGWHLVAFGKCLSILQPKHDGIELEVIGNIHDNPELLEVKS